MFSQNLMTEMNKSFKRAKDRAMQGTSVHKLELSLLWLGAISDASIANNAVLSSQLEHIILLTDQSGHANITSYANDRSKRVVRSTLRAETWSFVDCFDSACTKQDELYRAQGCRIPIAMLTDLTGQFNIIAKFSKNAARRLMIVLEATGEAYNNMDFDNIGRKRRNENVTDRFTRGAASKVLDTPLSTDILTQTISQWIVTYNIMGKKTEWTSMTEMMTVDKKIIESKPFSNKK